MRGGVVLVGFASFLASMLAVAWWLRSPKYDVSASAPEKPPYSSQEDDEDSGSGKGRPTVNRDKSAPQPKAVIEETTFRFGGMEVGEERSHAFVIRNEGNAPLAVVAGPTTCQCTVGKVDNDLIQPGQSTEVKLTWKPTMETEEFDKGAEIWTNDPEQETIKLSIKGIVAARLRVMPGYAWTLSEVKEDGTTELTGMVLSPSFDKFSITDIQCENKFATAESAKIEDPGMLKQLEALCGYKVIVKISSEINVGGFDFPMTIKTDLPDPQGTPIELKVSIRGSRRGPFRIVGKEWVPEFGAISMGAFDVGVGKTVTLRAVALQPPPEGLKIDESDIVCDPKELKVRLLPDEKAKPGSGRYLLSVEYPAGSPRVERRQENPARVKMRSNHPQAGEMEFMVFFAAY